MENKIHWELCKKFKFDHMNKWYMHYAESALKRRSQRGNQRNRNERQLLRHCYRNKKAVEPEGDGDTNCNWCTWNGAQRLGKKFGRARNQRKNGNHPDCSIVEISKKEWKVSWRLQWKTISKCWCEKLARRITIMIAVNNDDNNNNNNNQKIWHIVD